MTQYLSRRQAAAHLGRCDRTLRNFARLKIGPPFIMIGNRPAYPADALHEWLAANTMGGAQ